MLRNFKALFITLLWISAGIVFGAPVVQNFTNIQPFSDATYDNGTSTNRWLHIYSVTASSTNLIISGINGSTQCLHISGTGSVAGTGSDCSSGSAFPFTPTTWGGVLANSTSTPIQFLAGSISATSSIGILTAGTITATTTTATSTFNGGFIAGTNKAFTVNRGAIANTLYVAENGNVGIKTASPGTDLEVAAVAASAATLRITPASGSNANLEFYNGASSRKWSFYNNAGLSDRFQIESVGGAGFAIDQSGGGISFGGTTIVPPTTGALISGNVGIGTTSPSQLLSVHGNGLFSGNLLIAGLTATGTITFSGLSNGAVSVSNGVLSGGTLTVANGGTGQSTFTSSQLFYGNGTNGLSSVATGTISAGSSAITVTAGRAAVGGALSIDCAIASGSVAGCLSTANWNSFNNKWDLASTTIAVAYGGTGSTTLTGLLIGNGTSAINTYGGTSCTNQFPRSLSSSGVSTCATVANTDLTNSSLTINSGSGLTGGGSVALGGSLTLTAPFAFSPTTWGGLLANGTNTPIQLFGGEISATSSVGNLTVGTITATSTVNINNATVVDRRYATFTYATSSWSGTTTIQLGTAIVKETWNQAVCRTDGTLNVQFYNSSLLMNMLSASTASSTASFTTNNTLPALTNRKVDIGTPASSPSYITCTVDITINK